VRTRTAFAVLAGAALLAVATGFCIHVWFQERQRAFYAQYQQDTTEELRQWSREDKDRKVKAYQTMQQLQHEHRQSLKVAWGGAAEAACKNPDLSIAGMLEELAQACAQTSNVTVRVDRFTEFEISIRWDAAMDSGQLAKVSGCVLSQAAPFVRGLRFIQRGSVIAALDGRAIDSVSDWAKASLSDVQNLLTSQQSIASQNADSSDAGSWSTKLQNKLKDLASKAEDGAANGDGQRIRDAQETFDRTVASQNQRLRSVLQQQDQAGKLMDVLNAASLQSKLQLLRQAAVDLKQTREFLMNQDGQFRQLLQSREIDPLFVNIRMRSISERQAGRRPYLEAAFQALDERQSGAEFFLTEMQRTWGGWNVAGTMIQFTSTDAQRAYRQAADGFSQATDRVSAAMRALNDWDAAQH
jgi:hypothetical protein